ncbi:MAG: hypothetical protein WC120_05215 [Parcubacteria group bacterium]
MEIKSFLMGYRNLCASMATRPLTEGQLAEWRDHGKMADLALECLERREAECDPEGTGTWWRGACLKFLAMAAGEADGSANVCGPEVERALQKYGGTPSMIIGAAIALGRERGRREAEAGEVVADNATIVGIVRYPVNAMSKRC